jgi:hypothetical protein
MWFTVYLTVEQILLSKSNFTVSSKSNVLLRYLAQGSLQANCGHCCPGSNRPPFGRESKGSFDASFVRMNFESMTNLKVLKSRLGVNIVYDVVTFDTF